MTASSRRLVVVESPYAGEVERNVEYARAAMHDCFVAHGEYPIASHLLYTQPGILRDEVPEERDLGIKAGLAWAIRSDATVVYTDLGISDGMQKGMNAARLAGRPIEMRSLRGWKPGRSE